MTTSSFGSWQLAVELPHVLERADVVRFALDEELRLRAALCVFEKS